MKIDVVALTNAIGAAIEADVASAGRRAAAVLAQPVPGRSIIRMDGRRGRTPIDLYVASVSFLDGAGYGIKTFRMTADRSKAYVFGSAEMAQSIAMQIAGDFRGLGVRLEAK